jgi:hypothetical protein
MTPQDEIQHIEDNKARPAGCPIQLSTRLLQYLGFPEATAGFPVECLLTSQTRSFGVTLLDRNPMKLLHKL